MFADEDEVEKESAKSRNMGIAFVFIAIIICFIYVFSSNEVNAGESYTYENLKKDGLVSGFGIQQGNPLAMINQIKAIANPIYVNVKEGLIDKSVLCIGTLDDGKWKFTPISFLNTREIVQNKNNALSFCPLAGLSVSIPGEIRISGLLKYDTFVLYDMKQKKMIIPFDQRNYKGKKKIAYHPIQLLTYEGIVKEFPDSVILDPTRYNAQNPYGNYSTNKQCGIGHPKPGMKKVFKPNNIGYQAKELVLIAGFGGMMQKAYPFAALKKKMGNGKKPFEDTIAGKKVTVAFNEQYNWLEVKDKNGNVLNVAFSYIFALLQHYPDFELFKN